MWTRGASLFRRRHLINGTLEGLTESSRSAVFAEFTVVIDRLIRATNVYQ